MPTQTPKGLDEPGRGGTAFGTAVHAVLQEAVDQLVDRLPLGEADALDQLLAELDPGIAQIAARHADGQGVLDRQDEIICLANRALRSPAVEAGLRAPRQWSEIPVAASIQTPQDPIVVEGIIDLLYQDEDGQFVILDYKSDQVDSGKGRRRETPTLSYAGCRIRRRRRRRHRGNGESRAVPFRAPSGRFEGNRES